ncbi:MAG: radical SAM protein [archaeon]|nr:radical SAM protein [archaeon]
MMESYPRYVTKDFKPFDPFELAKRTEMIVCRKGPRGEERKYTSFYTTGVYGGIATGYACGCCLRCVFCWVDWSRDFPERFGNFYSPEDVFNRLRDVAHKARVNRARISNSEPTLGREHLIKLLEYVEDSDFGLFILETNGILFGVDKSYVRDLSKFKKVHIRVSLKAGNQEAFEKKTGALKESFDIPFKAIKNLLDFGVSFHVAAMSADPRIMSLSERKELMLKLLEMNPKLLLELEEEIIDPYNTTLARLNYAGLDLKWPLKEIYKPIKRILTKE